MPRSAFLNIGAVLRYVADSNLKSISSSSWESFHSMLRIKVANITIWVVLIARLLVPPNISLKVTQISAMKQIFFFLPGRKSMAVYHKSLYPLNPTLNAWIGTVSIQQVFHSPKPVWFGSWGRSKLNRIKRLQTYTSVLAKSPQTQPRSHHAAFVVNFPYFKIHSGSQPNWHLRLHRLNKKHKAAQHRLYTGHGRSTSKSIPFADKPAQNCTCPD